MRDSKKKLIGAVVLASLGALGVAEARLIDSFNNTNHSVQAGAGGTATHTAATAVGEAISGTRRLDIPGAIAVTGIGNLRLAANPGGSGLLSYSLDALTNGSSVVTWGGIGGADLTDGGVSTHFAMAITTIDQGSVTLIVRVTDTGANVASHTFVNAGVGTQTAPLSGFANAGATNFTSVQSVALEVQGVNGSDMTLDLLDTRDPNPDYDLGDAPDTYGTLRPTLAGPGNGPRHQLTDKLFLGAGVDADQATNPNGDGQPNALANGDDTNTAGAPTATFGVVGAGGDEDGVNPADLVFVDGAAKTITVQLNNTVGPGINAFLVGWIDFNGNGVFDPGSNEEATAVVPNGSATASLTWNVPANASTATGGASYARFRLSTTAGLLPTGDAGNGEVEDYPVTLNGAPPPPPPPPPVNVPVMGPWGLVLLILLMPAVAAAAQRRRRG